MKNSVIFFFLPSDEYKQNKIKDFFSEALLLLILINVLYFISAKFYNEVQISNPLFAFINILIPIIYILMRYILSGIEYTSIFTSTDYSKANKRLIKNAIKFFVVFAAITLIIKGLPSTSKETIELFGIAIISAIILFSINWLSLKLSYKKNKNIG
ncbi:hypothetical protein DCE79_10625 [Lysinibacillus sp. 2017]|uniref:hypothetical protein n=1 Tax=unclassified Lysinibacillus TaxID=2636778 RepID=UPI000D526545|nr:MULTISPECIES: hypothetical protein [unclassified Lysinibacillus]AWE07810.1 hypothetical protein DCE79_10625 [Lysinibacillus sp. 2017]TGN34631.1 hypothetical protein E4L99_13980 [Lysinibacillus sp. S2017]